jgi:uncharacterized protein
MRLRFTPQKHEFFALFSQGSQNAVAIARLLCGLLETFPEDSVAQIAAIKALEHEGDRFTHEIIDLLNRTFVTPFDRDDIYRLASALDDVCDWIDEAAHNLVVFGVVKVPDSARRQADVILRAAGHLDVAVGRLDGFKNSKSELIALRELEDEGDELLRAAVAELFRTEQDPVSIIRWKDIHETLEGAVDALENAADVLEAILVQNR